MPRCQQACFMPVKESLWVGWATAYVMSAGPMGCAFSSPSARRWDEMVAVPYLPGLGYFCLSEGKRRPIDRLCRFDRYARCPAR
jgi:hypothetical protein